MDDLNLEVFVMVDADGQAVVSTAADMLTELWTNEIGDVPAVSRVYKLNLTVPKPAMIEVSGKLVGANEAATLVLS